MKKILSIVGLLFVPLLLLASSNNILNQEVFPTVLSSQTSIELRKPIRVKQTDFLQSQELVNAENCFLKRFKHKKKDKNAFCEHKRDSSAILPAFGFLATSNEETLTLSKRKQIFSQADLPALNIKRSHSKLTFKAPLNAKGKRVQRIGAIKDISRRSTYTFHEGDYYIESLDIQSENPRKNDVFRLKTKGKVRIFLNSDSRIVKKATKYKRRAYIGLNRSGKPSNLLIFSKGKLTLEASKRLKVKAFIYAYQDITLIGNKNASFKGAVTSEGKFTIGKEEATHWKQKKAGKYVYDSKGVSKLDLGYESEKSLDTTPPLITLNGENNITLFQNETYEELGAKAIDEKDGEVDVAISASVDTTVIGIYTVTYTATDKAGNEASVIRTVTVVAPILKSLSLESNISTLNVGESAELTVMGTYSDGNRKRVDENVEYIITPLENVELNGAVLIAKKDGEVSVQVKVGTILSNTLNLNISWVVDGHVLPSEPDETLNNSTLLGIDTNDNGVRDDVERWIYEEYKDKHPIHVDIAMQAGRGYKLVLETPEMAKEIRLKVNAPYFCGSYYKNYAKLFKKETLVHSRIDTFVEGKYFNTKERKDIYRQYDKYLSGGVYTLPWPSEMKALCDFNTSKYGE